jgi:nucleoside-diphosphate-sugar epimerase
MRVVVVGATGSVGVRVVEALARREEVEQIIGVARRRPELQAPKTRFEVADIRHADLTALFRGADAVVHLAWMIQPGRDERVTASTNVDGSRRLVQAVVEAGVPALVYASSVGTYAPGPKTRRVDEDWPATGIASSFYSRHKAAVERELRWRASNHPALRIVALRPGLIFQRGAASEIQRLFLGPLFPRAAANPRLIGVLPLPRGLAVQAVHAEDVAEAYALAVTRSDVRGALNVAAEPVLDATTLAETLAARTVTVPPALVRAAAAASFAAHLQPTEPGWVDLALATPLMSTDRIRALGWSPRHSATDALHELLAGIRDRAGTATAPLHPAGRRPRAA